MLGQTYDNQNCSAARALEVVGERWSLLIIRDALFGGVTKFADFQRSLGLATNVLASRLDKFVDAGLMEARRYSEHFDHYEYVLTEKGRDLLPVVLALTAWGDHWAAPAGPPIEYQHLTCDGEIEQSIQCKQCGELVPTSQIKTRPGPGWHR